MEVDFDEDVTERGRYSPRFIDEIADEIDVIEDKKDNIFSKYFYFSDWNIYVFISDTLNIVKNMPFERNFDDIL